MKAASGSRCSICLLAKLAVVLIAASLLPAAHGQPVEPDLLLINAKVVTVDPNFSIAQALSVKEGRILATGTSEQLLASSAAAPDT
jgi:hypothetical protein